jgi:hypothetical protein
MGGTRHSEGDKKYKKYFRRKTQRENPLISHRLRMVDGMGLIVTQIEYIQLTQFQVR